MGTVPALTVRAVLGNAKEHDSLVHLGVNDEKFVGKVTFLGTEVVYFQPWRSPREAESLNAMNGIKIGPQPIAFTRKQRAKREADYQRRTSVFKAEPQGEPFPIVIKMIAYVREYR